MNWTFEYNPAVEAFSTSTLWLVAATACTLVFLYDERSWRGFAVHSLHHEMMRFRRRLIPLLITSLALTYTTTLVRSTFLTHTAVTLLSAVGFHIYQRTAFRFSARPMTGALKRILLIVTAALIACAMIPGFKSMWVPLLFMTASAASSLSSRNYLAFKLNDECIAMRQTFTLQRADRHNTSLYTSADTLHDNADDNARKAG